MYGDEEKRLEKAIAECERLRRFLKKLDEQAGEVKPDKPPEDARIEKGDSP